MTPTRPTRRSVLSTLAALVLPLAGAFFVGPGMARADVVFEPPPQLEVRSLATTYTTPPTSIELSITNPGTEEIETRGVRLVVVTGGVRVPLRLSRVVVDGQPVGVWDALTFAPRAARRVRLEFDAVPSTSLAAGRIDFALRFEGTAESTFSMRRAGR